MSVAVKVWITVLLAVLAGFTLLTLVKITRQPQARPVGAPVTAAAEQPVVGGDQPLNLAAFQMTRQNGQPFSFAELEGQVWVASLFFSSCPHECRQLNEAIAALQRQPAFEGVRFVSISVDPAVDTPQRLNEYAQLFEADADRWLFLNGKMADVTRFGTDVGVTTGYKTHTRRLVLLDKTGKVRGHFGYKDGAAIQQMSELAAQLVSGQEATSPAPAKAS